MQNLFLGFYRDYKELKESIKFK